MEISTLLTLGLSDDEAQAYLALLRLGGSRASVLAREIGLKRTTMYPILQSMARKGAVQMYYRDNHQLYYAQKPARFASLFRKKLEAFEQIIPTLAALEKQEAQHIGLRFITTIDELREFYRDILTECRGKSYRVIGDTGAWTGLDPEFFHHYWQDRARAKIRTQLLLTQESREENPQDSWLLREWKYLPEGYAFRNAMDIFNNKVLITSTRSSSLAVVIAVPAMVDIFTSLFSMLWNMLPDADDGKRNIRRRQKPPFLPTEATENVD